MMNRFDSLFHFMGSKGLTTLEIFYNQKQDRVLLRGMSEWDDNVRFEKYSIDFTMEDILTSNVFSFFKYSRRSSDELKSYSLEDVLDIYDEVRETKKQKRSGITNFFHFLFNIE